MNQHARPPQQPQFRRRRGYFTGKARATEIRDIQQRRGERREEEALVGIKEIEVERK
jgi:hypothetical protein